MRGFPLLNTLAVALFLAVAAAGLFRLTAGSPDPLAGSADPPPLAVPGQEVRCLLLWRFAHPPAAFSVRLGERTVWAASGPVLTEEETEATFPLPDGSPLELAVEVEWPPGTPRTVAELEIIPDGRDARIRSGWTEGSLRDVFVYSW